MMAHLFGIVLGALSGAIFGLLWSGRASRGVHSRYDPNYSVYCLTRSVAEARRHRQAKRLTAVAEQEKATRPEPEWDIRTSVVNLTDPDQEPAALFLFSDGSETGLYRYYQYWAANQPTERYGRHALVEAG